MKILADVMYSLHIVLLLTVLSPFILPAGEWLKYIILLICFILIDWNLPLGDGECSLTALESKLRGTRRHGTRPTDPDAPRFWHPLLVRLLGPFGIRLTTNQSDSLNYVVFILSLLVAFLRLCRLKKIRIRWEGIWRYAFGTLGLIWVINELWR